MKHFLFNSQIPQKIMSCVCDLWIKVCCISGLLITLKGCRTYRSFHWSEYGKSERIISYWLLCLFICDGVNSIQVKMFVLLTFNIFFWKHYSLPWIDFYVIWGCHTSVHTHIHKIHISHLHLFELLTSEYLPAKRNTKCHTIHNPYLLLVWSVM